MDIVAKKWYFQYFKNMPKNPTSNGAGGWYFDFPDINGAVSYVTDTPPKSLLPKVISKPYSLKIKGKITASEDAVFDYKTEDFNTCVVPATVRLLMMKNMYGEYNRWWAKEGIELKNGAFEISVPIDPAMWSSVYGKFGNFNAESLKGFWSAFQKKSFLGLSFGGGCFYGHGVRMSSGSARFELTSIEVI